MCLHNVSIHKIFYQNRFINECVLTFYLRGEGRRDWKVDLRYRVKKNHMFTLESIEFSFFTYITPLYIYLDLNRQY